MLVISRAYGRAAWTRACAFMIREVAIISWALVIFLIAPAERIRPRNSRSVAAIASTYFFFGGGLRTFNGSFLTSVPFLAPTGSSRTDELLSEVENPFLD